MTTRTKVIITTIVVAVVAFPLGPVIWPPAQGDGPGSLLPLFLVISAFESVALGIGVSFLVFGWPWVKRVKQEYQKPARILYFSIIWSLVSWWPHDNMHISNAHDNWGRLLFIEYLFHATLMLAAVGMAWSLVQILKRNQIA